MGTRIYLRDVIVEARDEIDGFAVPPIVSVLCRTCESITEPGEPRCIGTWSIDRDDPSFTMLHDRYRIHASNAHRGLLT